MCAFLLQPQTRCQVKRNNTDVVVTSVVNLIFPLLQLTHFETGYDCLFFLCIQLPSLTVSFINSFPPVPIIPAVNILFLPFKDRVFDIALRSDFHTANACEYKFCVRGRDISTSHAARIDHVFLPRKWICDFSVRCLQSR